MHKFTDGYFRLLRAITILCLIGMVVLVFGNVVLRYAFDSGITVSEEVARLLFVYMTFCGATIAMRNREHLGTDMLVSRLSPRGRRICFVLAQILMLGATALFLRGSWQQSVINLHVVAPVTGISMAAFYGVGIFFCISSGVILMADLWRALSGRMSDAELIGVRDSEDTAHPITEAAAHEPAAACPKRSGFVQAV